MMVQLKVLFTIFLVTSEFLLVFSENVQVASNAENYVPKNNVDNLKLAIQAHDGSVIENSDNNASGASEGRSGRSRKVLDSNSDIVQCAIALDGACLLNELENIVTRAERNLLHEADEEALKETGRKKVDKNNSPSALISSFTQMVFDVPGLVRDSISGISGLISSGGNLSLLTEDDEDDGQGKDEEVEEDEDDDDYEDDDEEEDEADKGENDDEDDDDDDDDVEEEVEETVEAINDENQENEDENNVENENSEVVTEEPNTELRTVKRKCKKKKGRCVGKKRTRRGGALENRELGVGRNKKKKKKKAILKLLLVAMVLKAKLAMLLKLIATKLQFKFLLIAGVNLLINLARFWWDLKKGHGHPQKVIYYEHAQHQHHYDHDHDDWASPGGSYWGRSYEEEENNPNNPHAQSKNGQEMAYSQQIPIGFVPAEQPAEDTETKINSGALSWNPWS